jgi:hypothetical protein
LVYVGFYELAGPQLAVDDFADIIVALSVDALIVIPEGKDFPELPLPRGVIHDGQKLDLPVGQQRFESRERGTVCDLKPCMDPGLHVEPLHGLLDPCDDVGGHAVGPDPDLVFRKGDRVVYRRHPAGGKLLVQFHQDDVQREEGVRAGLQVLLQGVAVHVDETGQQPPAVGIDPLTAVVDAAFADLVETALAYGDGGPLQGASRGYDAGVFDGEVTVLFHGLRSRCRD